MPQGSQLLPYRLVLASPYVEGIAFDMTRGEDGASAVWTGYRQPHPALDCRTKPLGRTWWG